MQQRSEVAMNWSLWFGVYTTLIMVSITAGGLMWAGGEQKARLDYAQKQLDKMDERMNRFEERMIDLTGESKYHNKRLEKLEK
jgi:hypothetical protein